MNDKLHGYLFAAQAQGLDFYPITESNKVRVLPLIPAADEQCQIIESTASSCIRDDYGCRHIFVAYMPFGDKRAELHDNFARRTRAGLLAIFPVS